MNETMRYVVGIDIGGTFTDIVLLNRETKRYRVHKLLTSSSDPSHAVIQGLREILEAEKVDISRLDYIVHGTTLTANTIIQRRGARTALITTEGFEDLLEMRNEQRYDANDLFSTFPEPLVPEALRLGARERIASDGQVLLPLDREHLRRLTRLLAEQSVESVAICFLHAHTNPVHEQAARDAIAEALPGVAVSVSSEIGPRAGEFGRLSTTAANAYVQPVMARYLDRLEGSLRDLGAHAQLYLMQSDGGMTSTETAKLFPVRMFESGPAAGITVTAQIGKQSDEAHLIAFDMGGTTAKICIVDDGTPLTTWNLEVDRADRFSRGSGLPLNIPSFEMIEIGAGGGSLAHINELGLLKVGPRSAESNPGPSCYGLGGDQPTVTDALLLLGYLNPNYFLGGRIALDQPKASDVIQRDVAEPMGLSLEDAALGIYRIACSQMAEATRVQIAERGKDARRYSIVAFGGAGPVHACEIARSLRIPRVIVPPSAGIMSACGLLMAPLSFHVARSYNVELAAVDFSELQRRFQALSQQARQVLADAHVADADMSISWSLDLKYVGQKHTVEVRLREQRVTSDSAAEIVEEFERLYIMLHGRANRALSLFVETIKVHASGPAEPSTWLAFQDAPDVSYQPTARRRVRFVDEPAAIDCPVLARNSLVAGQAYDGPAIIEERETTTIIGPRDRYEIDAWDNLIVHLNVETPPSRTREVNTHVADYTG